MVATVVTLFIVPLVYSALRNALPMLHLLDAKFQTEKAGGYWFPPPRTSQRHEKPSLMSPDIEPAAIWVTFCLSSIKKNG